MKSKVERPIINNYKNNYKPSIRLSFIKVIYIIKINKYKEYEHVPIYEKKKNFIEKFFIELIPFNLKGRKSRFKWKRLSQFRHEREIVEERIDIEILLSTPVEKKDFKKINGIMNVTSFCKATTLITGVTSL